MLDLDASCAQAQRASSLYFHRPHTFRTGPSSQEITEFLETWSRLRPDQYLEHPANRSRRVAKFIYSLDANVLQPIQDTSFFQSSAVNPLLGGITRHYQRSEPAFIDSPVLRDVLEQDCRHICEIGDGRRWLITCHQFRIHCRTGEIGQPTPEGLHCDGHSYVFQHFIQKSNIAGGQSRVCSRSGATIALITLSTFLETIFLDDRELLHDVSPIMLAPGSGSEGFRDMLVIDFDPAESQA